MTDFQPEILLTGAGLTHNIGAPLASGLWAQIFSHSSVQRVASLRLAMVQQGFDFERVYEEVMMTESQTLDARAAMAEAIDAAYSRIDSVIRHYHMRNDPPLLLGGYWQFVNQFAGDGDRKGFYFTVNQDLMVERLYRDDHIFTPVTLPGLTAEAHMRRSPPEKALAEDDLVEVPSEQQLSSFHTDIADRGHCFFYVKLHGSHNWRRSDAKRTMVIGRTKDDLINAEPLLATYYRLFRQVLLRPERRLMVIGYGFRDEHINSVIVEGVRKFGLRVFVINPTSPSELKHVLEAYSGTKLIWDQGLAGYFQYSLQDLFPRALDRGEPLREVYQTYFGRNPPSTWSSSR